MAYQNLTFGTAGIRGIMGDGEGEINLETIAAISHSLARVLKKKYSGGKVVFCYDSRHNGKEFAACAARAIGSYGFSVFVPEEPCPTPFLSFAVKEMAAVAGVNITASHNPKEYTGYKAYAEDGAQIDVTFALEVQNELAALSSIPQVKDTDLQPIPRAVYSSYLHIIAKNNALSKTDFSEFRALFTPLCGSSGHLLRTLTEENNLPLDFVENQMAPNGDFPGLPKPNPDDEAVFAKALTYGNYPLILANDPDGDRLGAMVKGSEGYKLLSGNDIGVLLLYYILETTLDLTDKYIVKSIVSTDFAWTIAADYGVAVKNVLVGFRYIAQKIQEDEGNFLFGFEESGGYLAHAHVGDKDGIEAAVLLLKAGAYYYKKHKTLLDVLAELSEKYGEVKNITLTKDLSVSDSTILMASLRAKPPVALGAEKIISFDDYLKRNDALQGDLILFETKSTKFILRPSGTEPKMKIYLTLSTQSNNIEAALDELFNERLK